MDKFDQKLYTLGLTYANIIPGVITKLDDKTLPSPLSLHHQQQQQSSNVVLVQHQPQPAVVALHRYHAPGDQGMVLAVIATFIIVFFGCWFGLICTIPAIILASNVRHDNTVKPLLTPIPSSKSA